MSAIADKSAREETKPDNQLSQFAPPSLLTGAANCES